METIAEIREKLQNCPASELQEWLREYEQDSRKGVQKLLDGFWRKQAAQLKEEQRLDALLSYERQCYAEGYELVAGIDEVGRGPLAGPVVAAAVILPKECRIEGVNDSKKLTPRKREELYGVILEKAVAYGVGVVPPERIDEINILQATFEAMRQALAQLSPAADYILVDAVTIYGIDTPQKGIVKGDEKSLSIGEASIVAKVHRDRMMVQYDEIYPGYGFAANKGYGSAEHIAAIREKGICAIHRRSFVKNFLPGQGETAAEKGGRGEALAARQMERMGYEILERNYRRRDGEIDIIAQKDGYTVFTEVKYRKNSRNGFQSEAVDWRKQQSIIRTAKAYVAEKGLEGGEYRFDVAEILTGDGKTYFRYTEDAFRLP